MELLGTKHPHVQIHCTIMTTWKDKLTTQKDGRQSGKTFDTCDRTPRVNGFAPQIQDSIATESTTEEKGSQDPRERREDKRDQL